VITPTRDGRSLRVWSSPDGREWSGGTRQALPDATGSRVHVERIVSFGGELIGVGTDFMRLAVWRSDDCGATWSREADRPEFALDPRGKRVSATIAFATDEAVVVIATQAQRGLPYRRWAWLLRRDGSWERSPDPLGLPRVVIAGPPDTGHWGVTYQAGVPIMVRSSDLVTWAEVGPLPGDSQPAWDEASGRWLISSQPTDEYPSSAILWVSTDGTTWSEVARTMPNLAFGIPTVHASDGVVVWVVHSSQGPRLMCLAREPSASPGPDACRDWSWAATSVDGGNTWTVSAGWPGMTFRGGFGDPAVAIGPDSVVLATFPGHRGESRIWTSAR
jgi:hypothetical protein